MRVGRRWHGVAALGSVAAAWSCFLVVPARAEQAAAKVLIGKVHRMALEAETPHVEVKAKRRRYRIEFAPGCKIVRHEAVPIEKIPAGAKLHVLGRYQEEQQDPDTQRTLPPQIQGIVAAIADPDFEPPPLTKRQAAARLRWFSGTLHVEAGGHLYKLDDTALLIGRARPIVLAKAADRRVIERGMALWIRGEALGGTKARALRATRIAVLGARISPKEYAALLGQSR